MFDLPCCAGKRAGGYAQQSYLWRHPNVSKSKKAGRFSRPASMLFPSHFIDSLKSHIVRHLQTIFNPASLSRVFTLFAGGSILF